MASMSSLTLQCPINFKSRSLPRNHPSKHFDKSFPMIGFPRLTACLNRFFLYSQPVGSEKKHLRIESTYAIQNKIAMKNRKYFHRIVIFVVRRLFVPDSMKDFHIFFSVRNSRPLPPALKALPQNGHLIHL